MKRRHFLAGVAGLAAAAALPRRLGANARQRRVVLLHTNDTHSRLDPFPLDGGRYEGLAGVARRKTLIVRERAREPHVLLVDAGDVFQGTPYFNLFKGVADYQAMSRLGYDLGTLGNHDFDEGVDTLKAAMQHASFGFVSANYAFDDPDLAARVRPYVVRELGGLRVGVLGLGVAFQGLVAPHLHQGVRYRDAVEAASEVVTTLREKERVHAVVALTHLGIDDDQHSPGDRTVAARVPGIDLILGGHSHTFLKRPEGIRRPDGGTCWVHQVGFAGIWLGRVTLEFEGERLAAVRGGAVTVA